MNRYESLASELEHAIRGGVLRPGERLPSVRKTSQARRVSASTVFQAYYLLEGRGLIEARERSGYFVANVPAVLPRMRSASTPRDESIEVQISDLVFDALEVAGRPHVVPIGSPFPDPALFPLPQLGRSIAEVARAMTPLSMIDELSPGKEALRRHIAMRYVAQGMDVHHDEIVITNGAMEALNLCLTVVAKAGDAVIVESPTFYGALQALERLGLRAVAVPTHGEEGIDLERLEHAIRQHRPKACWLMPTFQNPLGSTMSDDNKRALVGILTRHGVALIEDDVYAELHFDAARARPAKVWDSEGIVLHCSSFSKCLAPGYRIGWAAPGARYFRQVARNKVTTSLMTSMPTQMALAAYFDRGGYEQHLRKLRKTLAARHEQFAEAVGREFPAGSTATRAQGGYFMWVQMPPGVDAIELHKFAAAQRVCVAAGAIFTPRAGEFSNCVRLNFSYPFDERMQKAVAMIGKFACDAAARS